MIVDARLPSDDCTVADRDAAGDPDVPGDQELRRCGDCAQILDEVVDSISCRGQCEVSPIVAWSMVGSR